MRFYFQCVLAACLFIPMVANAESEVSFAKTVQNPLAVNPEARYFTLPFNNYTNFDYGSPNHTQDLLDLKPVTPFRFTSSYDLIFRTIIQFAHQPSSDGYTNGLGDINTTAFIAPAKNSNFLWGIGPTLTMPTATNKNLGAGKWSVGPELALIAMPEQWTFAILTNNIWSVAGESNRVHVNQFSFQYYITYNLPSGWYVTTQPTITANWISPPSQQWTVPVGGGAGRAFHIGHQAVNLLLESYSNVIRPKTGARWFVQANLTFLFPDNRTA